MNATAILLIETLWPGVVVAGAAMVVLPWLRADDGRARAAVVAVAVLLMWRYLLWRWSGSLPPLGLTFEYAVGLLFVAVESLTVIGATINLVFLARLSNRSADADSNAAWLADRRPPPLADVFICTYNEEAAILERTIIGALSMDYPRYRVWVLDDGRRGWLKDLCQRLGSGYLTRADNSHAKAGNINSGLRHVAGLAEPPEFVSILDADFVPTPQFLRRSLSLFNDDSVGIVQTPQHFINPDPLQSNLSAARVWPDEQRYFFDVVMASKDAWGAAFCCGTSSVIRFSALQRIGGFPTESVTEDYLVTLKMNAVGYRTIYLNERLSMGLAPEGLKEYITQRSRWALGFMQIFRGALGPFRFRNGLNLVDRVSLIDAFLYWFASHAFRLLGIIVPLLFWLFNINAVHADVAVTLFYYVPHFIAQITIMHWMTQGRVMPLLSDVTQLLAATQVLRAVARGLIKPKGHKFQVTAKGGDRSHRFVQWPLLRVFLIFLILTLGGIIWAFLFEDGGRLRDSSALCLFWSWYNIVVLAIACVVCVEQPRFRTAERLPARDRAIIRAGAQAYEHCILDISLGGARFAGSFGGREGMAVTIALDDLRLPATIVRCGDKDFAARFDARGPADIELIRHIYSGRYSATITHIRPVRVAATVLERILR